MTTSNISDDRFFYIVVKDPEGNELYSGENPIASGIKAIAQTDDDGWGYLSWFDLVNGVMRSMQLKSAPVIKENKNIYEFTTVEDYTYVFEIINKHIYDSIIRSIIPNSPDLESDPEIQNYLAHQNPYF